MIIMKQQLGDDLWTALIFAAFMLIVLGLIKAWENWQNAKRRLAAIAWIQRHPYFAAEAVGDEVAAGVAPVQDTDRCDACAGTGKALQFGRTYAGGLKVVRYGGPCPECAGTGVAA